MEDSIPSLLQVRFLPPDWRGHYVELIFDGVGQEHAVVVPRRILGDWYFVRGAVTEQTGIALKFSGDNAVDQEVQQAWCPGSA